jgi:hypothetical protein
MTLDPIAMLKPRRKITGMSAILLPFKANGDVDWHGWETLIARTLSCSLIPAVNMDTGYGNLIDEATKSKVLGVMGLIVCTSACDEYVAGAYVADIPGAKFDFDAYRRAIDPILVDRGTPIIFQSYGLTSQPGPEIVESYRRIGEHCGRFLAFELGKQFAPFGAIYNLETYEGLLGLTECVGAKHSSLSRELEWERLLLRDRIRPDFLVLTGNDLAIDMVQYGSDYLLGLSAFAPAEFALRDKLWAEGHPGFYELNDLLQYLGAFAFRPPVPAYKHSAAMFLKLRGWIGCDRTHPASPQRPDSDRAILKDILDRLNALTETLN